MKLLTKEILAKLPKFYETENVDLLDKVAVVKYFNPCGSQTWYGIEYSPEENSFFGYVTGMQEDELGYFSLDELASVKLPFGLSIERDLHWSPKKLRDIQEVMDGISEKTVSDLGYPTS